MTRHAPVFADWQRFTHDPADTHAVARCGRRSPVKSPSPEMGICLRSWTHGPDWHEGRSADGTLVSWPADDRKSRS